MVSTKIIKTVFNIDYKEEMFLKILEWFLDHVTTKTTVMTTDYWVMTTENSVLQYYCLYCISNQINTALVSIKDFLQKQNKQKNVPTPKLWLEV